MTATDVRRSRWMTLLVALYAAGAAAGVVSVDVKTKIASGNALDTVLVFDPLDAKPPPTHATFDIDQIRKTFEPRVSVVRTGTVVSFPNSDNIHHEVYSFSPPHRFTLEMFAGESHQSEIFDKPGILVLGCDIHDSMVAFVVVADSPYFVKTPASGHATLNLPPGRYRLRVWNVDLASSARPDPITVGAEPVSLTVTLDQVRDTPEHWSD